VSSSDVTVVLPQPRLTAAVSVPWPHFPAGYEDPPAHFRAGHLTSTAVTATPDLYLDAAGIGLLIPHEGLRHEMIRADKLLRLHFRPQSPEHVRIFYVWFDEFFYPSLHEHHDSEENVFVPRIREFFARTKSMTLADFGDPSVTMKTQHQELARRLEAVKNCRHAPADLVSTWKEFFSYMLDHLEEEERVWPPVMRAVGTEEMRSIEKEIVDHGRKHGGKAFSMFFGAIHDAMLVWATQSYYDKFMSSMPGFVICMIVPGWIRDYRQHCSDLALLATV
jgi:iron-sulfur cluster repair protein YtfE (RIC family)